MIPVLRAAVDDDLPAIAVADGRSFGITYTAEDIENFRTLYDPDRFLLACDPTDGEILGVTGSFPFDVTMPGGATLPVSGVTWVSVSPTHRRRGILRAMMAQQHRGFIADRAALSLLTASEGGIYGRYGYGPASTLRGIQIDRAQAAFRGTAPEPGGVRMVDAATARALAPDIYRRWCTHTPGSVSRSSAWWDDLMRDPEHRRGGATELYRLLHADGYCAYRIKHGERTTCEIVAFFAITPQAHAAMWRVLLGLDLVETITSWSACPLDDPLPLLLTDHRAVRTTSVRDGLWCRVLDVPAALAARTYATELDVVIDVTDTFLDRGGRFRLRGGPDGATCETTTTSAQLHTDMATLGSLLFGGHRARTLARGGLITTEDPTVLALVDAAFLADREPQHGTAF